MSSMALESSVYNVLEFLHRVFGRTNDHLAMLLLAVVIGLLLLQELGHVARHIDEEDHDRWREGGHVHC